MLLSSASIALVATTSTSKVGKTELDMTNTFSALSPDGSAVSPLRQSQIASLTILGLTTCRVRPINKSTLSCLLTSRISGQSCDINSLRAACILPKLQSAFFLFNGSTKVSDSFIGNNLGLIENGDRGSSIRNFSEYINCSTN